MKIVMPDYRYYIIWHKGKERKGKVFGNLYFHHTTVANEEEK